MMRIAQQRQRDISGKIVTTVFFILLSYFLYHSISGERGLLAMIRLNQELTRAQAQLDILHAERLQQEHRVSLLRPESLDLDLLDQQARELIGYAAADEVVVTP